jgi:hypothetical protein
MSRAARPGAKYPNAVIPGYTHLRRAQPVLWPHYLLAYFEMLARDHERLGDARRRANVMPLGSGALAGSGFPHDREAIARDLGFASITRNSMDVSADRDFALDYLYAASVTMIHLSRLAEDWILYSSEEFGWMELGDGVTSGSSLMPQKKNPDSLELIRGKSGRVLGALNSLLFTMKGLPMTYNRDMQEDKEPLFEAADQVNGCLEMARAVAESVMCCGETFRRGRRRKLGGRHGSRRSAGAQRHGVSSGPPDCRDVWCSKACATARSRRLDGGIAGAFAPEFTPDVARLLDPREGMKTREIRAEPDPKRGCAARSKRSPAPGELAWHDEELPARPDPQADSRRNIFTQEELARAPGARAWKPRR